MQDNHPKRVEDYTTASLVLLGVNLIWIFTVVWSLWGLGAALGLALLLNYLITRLDSRKRRKARG